MVLFGIPLSDIVSIATALSCLSAFGGLIYAGYQIKQNTDIMIKNTYLNANERYLDIRKMVIEDETLADIYNDDMTVEQLSAKQKYYIFILITFCESLFLTDQIDLFPQIRGGNWKNFIRHTISDPIVSEIWKKETEIPDPDWSLDFISYVNLNILKL